MASTEVAVQAAGDITVPGRKFLSVQLKKRRSSGTCWTSSSIPCFSSRETKPVISARAAAIVTASSKV